MNYLDAIARTAKTKSYAILANNIANQKPEFALFLAGKGLRGNVTPLFLHRIAPDYFLRYNGLTKHAKSLLRSLQKDIGLSKQATIKEMINGIQKSITKPFKF